MMGDPGYGTFKHTQDFARSQNFNEFFENTYLAVNYNNRF